MPTAVITFDDVVRSQLENAVPVLQKHGFKATFFVCDWFRDSRIHALKQGMDMADLKTLHQRTLKISSKSCKSLRRKSMRILAPRMWKRRRQPSNQWVTSPRGQAETVRWI